MNDNNWRSEWSRHYDQIQWIATTLFTAGIGALLTFSYSQATPSLVITLIGVWLTIVTVVYAVSFRNTRDQLHNNLPDLDERDFLIRNRQRRLRQWSVFFVTFVGFIAAWVRQFFRSDYRLGITARIVALITLVWLWERAKDTRRAKPSTINK